MLRGLLLISLLFLIIFFPFYLLYIFTGFRIFAVIGLILWISPLPDFLYFRLQRGCNDDDKRA